MALKTLASRDAVLQAKLSQTTSGPVGRAELQAVLNDAVMGVPGSYAVAGLPDAATYEGRIIYCSNGAAGSPCLAYSNGTNWLRVLLGAAVAAT